MNKSENIHRLFDGELSEDEQKLLEEAMSADSELAGELASIQSMAALHAETMPAPKDEVFIENEFLEIQKRIQSSDNVASHENVTTQSAPTPDASNDKVVFFPGSKWLRGTLAIAAALTITVAGTWLLNQNESGNSTTAPDAGTVAFVETDIDGASSMIYMDEQSGWTFVWVDEPLDDPEEIAG